MRNEKETAREPRKRIKGWITEAENAIEELFSDTSVTQETTLEALRELRGNIQCKIESIESDLRRKAVRS